MPKLGDVFGERPNNSDRRVIAFVPKGQRRVAKVGDQRFVETEHPRDEGGKFTSSGGSTVALSGGSGSVRGPSGRAYGVKAPTKGSYDVTRGTDHVGRVSNGMKLDGSTGWGAMHTANPTDTTGKKFEAVGDRAESPHEALAGLVEHHEKKNGIPSLGGQVGRTMLPSRRASEEIRAKHTMPDGTVDYDAVVADHLARGLYPPAETSERSAVFLLGGGGSGKGGILKRHYTGTPDGAKDSLGQPIDANHPEYVAPMPGFAHDRVYDSDAEKKRVPTFSHKPGDAKFGHFNGQPLGGPSGPLSLDELRQYPLETQKALRDYVVNNTPYGSLEEFASGALAGEQNHDPAGTKYGGGLTHELSSWVTKQRINNQVADPAGKSFVVDSVGGEGHRDLMDRAIQNGYRVVLHHAEAAPEVAQMRNAKRERTVPADRLEGTHAKAEKIIPKLKEHAESLAASGKNAAYIRQATSTPGELAEAVALGYTRHGHIDDELGHPSDTSRMDDQKATGYMDQLQNAHGVALNSANNAATPEERLAVIQQAKRIQNRIAAHQATMGQRRSSFAAR